MRKLRFTRPALRNSQILAFMKQNVEGAKVPDLCREHGFSNVQFYNWRSKFGGMDASMMKRMKELVEENKRLMCITANVTTHFGHRDRFAAALNTGG